MDKMDRLSGRITGIDRLVKKVKQTGSQLVFTAASEFAAVHAAAEGLISTRELSSIRREQKKDESPQKSHILTKEV